VDFPGGGGRVRRRDSEALEAARSALKLAKKPVVYAGGGIVLGGAVDRFRRFIDRTRLPVVNTLKGIRFFPRSTSSFSACSACTAGRRRISRQGADLLFAVGVRFDDRATGNLSRFAPGAKVVHLDIDRAEVGKLRDADVGLVGELGPSLDALSGPLEAGPWRAECLENKRRYAPRYDAPSELVCGPRFLRELTRRGGENLVVTCDVGQHQMWVAQHGLFSRPEQHLSSGGLGTMGYGLPAAIGAQLGRPEVLVVNVAGDALHDEPSGPRPSGVTRSR
jgi:acetolactate synthase-1/2/3 large subunit